MHYTGPDCRRAFGANRGGGNAVGAIEGTFMRQFFTHGSSAATVFPLPILLLTASVTFADPAEISAFIQARC